MKEAKRLNYQSSIKMRKIKNISTYIKEAPIIRCLQTFLHWGGAFNFLSTFF